MPIYLPESYKNTDTETDTDIGRFNVPSFIYFVRLLQIVANVVCEGYVFTGVCLSTGGTPAGRPIPLQGDPPAGRPPGRRPPTGRLPRRETPLEGGNPPKEAPPGRRPPPYGYCCERYASYWNAFFFDRFFLHFSTILYHSSSFRFH